MMFYNRNAYTDLTGSDYVDPDDTKRMNWSEVADTLTHWVGTKISNHNPEYPAEFIRNVK